MYAIRGCEELDLTDKTVSNTSRLRRSCISNLVEYHDLSATDIETDSRVEDVGRYESRLHHTAMFEYCIHSLQDSDTLCP